MDGEPLINFRPRALVVSARFPAFSAPMAGHRVCAAHIANLAEHYDVDLLVVCRDTEDFSELERMQALCGRVEVLKLTRGEGLLNILTHLLLPLPAAARSSPRIARAFSLFSDTAYELAHFEWTETVHLAPLVNAKRKQAMCHDILSELFGRRAGGGVVNRIMWEGQVRNALRYEATQLPLLDRVFVPSDADAADLIGMGVPSDRVSVVGPEFYRVEPVAKPWDNSPRNLLLWGAFSREENREAARTLLKDIMPCLAGENIQLLIAGSDSDRHYKSSGNVQVLGRVPHPESVFAKAHIAVYPLYHGSGLKIKVIEALYAGLPVLTTSVGKEGYDCNDEDGLILAETPEEFVRWIKQLVSDRKAYESASVGAAKWARAFIERSKFGVV